MSDGQIANFRCHGAVVWPRYVVSMFKPDLAISLRPEREERVPRVRRPRSAPLISLSMVLFAVGRDRKRAAKPGAALICLAAVAMTVVLGACGSGGGGDSSVGVAQVGKATSTTATQPTAPAADGTGVYEASLAWAQCMRKHGAPDFPDPDSVGSFPRSALSKLDANSPQFQAAMRDCRSLQPRANATQVAQANAELLKFSACMRKEGEPDFPDFMLGGGPQAAARQYFQRVDPNTPQFQSAFAACRSLLPPSFAASLGS